MIKRLVLLLFTALGVPAFSAVSFVSQTETEVTVAANSWACNLPGSIADGDILLVILNTNTSATVNSTPSNTDLLEHQAISDNDGYLYAKVAASEGATLTFGYAANETGHCVILAYRGALDPVDTQSESASNGAVTSISGPAVVPSADNSMILQIVGTDPGGITCDDDTSPDATERAQHSVPTGVVFTCVQEYLQPTAASESLDYTNLANTSAWWSMQLYLLPSSTSGLLLRRRR